MRIVCRPGRLDLALTILIWGSSATAVKYLVSRMALSQMMFYVCLFSTLTFAVAVHLQRARGVAGEFPPLLKGGWLGFLGIFLYLNLYLGVVSSGLGYMLWFKALGASTHLTCNGIYLVPFVSILFLHFLLGTRVEPISILGLALIVGGILFSQTGVRPWKSGKSQVTV